MNAPYGPNIAAAEYTHTLIIFIKKQIRQKEDVKTYEAVSENDEHHCCCHYASLFCSLNFHRRRSMMHSLLLLSVLIHFFHYPIRDKTKKIKIKIERFIFHTFCEGVLRVEPLSLCGLRLLSSLCDCLRREAEFSFDESPFS